MARAEKPAKEQEAAAESEEGGAREGRLRWFVGWVIVPGLVIGSIFGAGVHLGASEPEAWYTRAVLWIVGLFG